MKAPTLLLPLLIVVGLLVFVMSPTDVCVAQSAVSDEDFVPLLPDLFAALNVDISKPTEAVAILINGLFKLTVGVASLLAVIMVAIGGVQYMTTDSSFNLGNARERISSAIIGLAIVLLCVLVFNLINSRLTSLQLFHLSAPPGTGNGFSTGGSF